MKSLNATLNSNAEFLPDDAALYRKAAALLLVGKCCPRANCGWACCALSKAIPAKDNHTYHRLQGRFRDAFGDSEWFGKEKTPKYQAARIAALLEMAANAECLSEFVP